MNTYLIRGFTGPNADFSFKLLAPDYPTGLDLRDVVLGHFTHECGWATDLDTVDVYALSEDEERSDLRETDSQRVYLFDSEDCNVHVTLDDCCAGSECEHDSYMITVDLIDTEDQ